MKRKYFKLTKRLFILSGVLLMIFQVSTVHAERYKGSYQKQFIETKSQVSSGFYDPQRKPAPKALPEGAILCEGKVVFAPEVIKQQLSCTQKNVKSSFLALF